MNEYVIDNDEDTINVLFYCIPQELIKWWLYVDKRNRNLINILQPFKRNELEFEICHISIVVWLINEFDFLFWQVMIYNVLLKRYIRKYRHLLHIN